jgi:outer membrane protein
MTVSDNREERYMMKTTCLKKYRSLAASVIMVLGFFGIISFHAGTAYAATEPAVGIVNFQYLMSQHPDMATLQTTMQAAVQQAQSDFNKNSVNMNDKEKQDYSAQLQQGLQIKHQELLDSIRDKIVAAVKEVAEAKHLTIVVDSSAAVFGGQDITNDVLAKITGK